MLPPSRLYSISKLLADPAPPLDTFPTMSTYENWEIPATPSEATSGSWTLNENSASLKTPKALSLVYTAKQRAARRSPGQDSLGQMSQILFWAKSTSLERKETHHSSHTWRKLWRNVELRFITSPQNLVLLRMLFLGIFLLSPFSFFFFYFTPPLPSLHQLALLSSQNEIFLCALEWNFNSSQEHS